MLALPYEIKPALSLVSELVHVKQLEAGQDIGYGATYTTEDAQWIGTIPIGYADGWIRQMQNFHVLIKVSIVPLLAEFRWTRLLFAFQKNYLWEPRLP